MAGMSGVGGNIAMSGCIGGVIKSWTANLTRPSTDITGFGNATKNRAVGKSERIGNCFVIEICERNVFDNITDETDDED